MPPAPPGQPADLPRPPVRITTPRGRGRPRLLGRAGRDASPGEPWLADHPWRRDGAEDETGREARRALLGGGLLTLVGSAAGAALLPEVEGALVVVPALVLGGFLAAGLWLLSRGVLSVLRRSHHGVTELRWGRFPFFLGEPLDATLVRDGASVRLDGLLARLTCVEERWERRTGPVGEPAHDPGRRRVERWSETRRVAPAGATRVPLRFDLPPPGPEAPGTALRAELATYWELEVWADLPGPDFHAVFLVPVYRRPGGPPPRP